MPLVWDCERNTRETDRDSSRVDNKARLLFRKVKSILEDSIESLVKALEWKSALEASQTLAALLSDARQRVEANKENENSPDADRIDLSVNSEEHSASRQTLSNPNCVNPQSQTADGANTIDETLVTNREDGEPQVVVRAITDLANLVAVLRSLSVDHNCVSEAKSAVFRACALCEDGIGILNNANDKLKERNRAARYVDTLLK